MAVFISGSFVAFILFTGLVSGSYPAFFLSSFKAGRRTERQFQKSRSPGNAAKSTRCCPFSFAIILIVSTLVIDRQIKYAAGMPGYDRNKLVYISMFGDIEKNYQMIRAELMNKQWPFRYKNQRTFN